MIKASSNLQDPRRGLYGKRKAEWLRWYAKASDESGGVVDGGSGHSDLGDESWAVYESGSERISLINLVVKCAGARSAGNSHAACARWRELETELRTRLNGHEGGNPGYSQADVLTGHRASRSTIGLP